MVNLLRSIDEKLLFPLRINYLTQLLSPFLRDSEKILDLGSSDGRLAFNLSKILSKTDFVGVDMHVQPKTYIPIKKYDGKKLPFPDNSFDCVMIIDVLHHCNNPEEVLNEAKRVTRKHILIKDHYWNNKFDYLLLKYADYIGNKPYGVKLPYNFLRMNTWKNMINNSYMKIISLRKFRYNFFDPCRHVIFLLEK